jgi:hypothetical protein
MNHRYRPAPSSRLHAPRSIAAAVVVALAVAACSSTALAQRALPADLKGAADVRPRIAEIQKFVATQVAALSNDKDPKAQEKARNALASETSGGGPAFLDAYAATVNEQLLPLAKSPSLRTRLLASITLCRVANAVSASPKAGTTSAAGQLADAAAAFAQDDSVGISLWGIRSAQPIVLALAQAGQPTKLTAAVVKGVEKHPTSGDLVDDAYRALALNYKTDNFNNTSIKVILKDLLAMYSFRVSQYLTTTPPKPELDLRGTNFLTLARVWESPAWQPLQNQIRQEIVNLIGVAAQHAAAREDNDRRPFVDLLKNAGSALFQIARRPDVNDAGLQAAATKLAQVRTGAAPEEFTKLATEAQQAMAAKFPGVKPYPEINPEATAAPSPPEIPDTTGDDLVNKDGGSTTRPSKSGGSTAGAGGPATGKSPTPPTPGRSTPTTPAHPAPTPGGASHPTPKGPAPKGPAPKSPAPAPAPARK